MCDLQLLCSYDREWFGLGKILYSRQRAHETAKKLGPISMRPDCPHAHDLRLITNQLEFSPVESSVRSQSVSIRSEFGPE